MVGDEIADDKNENKLFNKKLQKKVKKTENKLVSRKELQRSERHGLKNRNDGLKNRTGGSDTNSFLKYLPAKIKPAKTAESLKNPEIPQTIKSGTSFVKGVAPTRGSNSNPWWSTEETYLSKKAKSASSADRERYNYNDKVNVETCDILFIDDHIKTHLRHRTHTVLPDLYSDLKDLTWIVRRSPDPIDQIIAQREIPNLRRKIQGIEDGYDFALYLFHSSNVVDEYKKLVADVKVNFVKALEVDEGTAEKNYKKNKLILDFLRIAKDYIILENYKQKAQKIICDVCYGHNLTAEDDETILRCECGNIVETLDDTPTFKDSERVNMSSRYTYTCRGHFTDAMNRFEGKQNTEIDKDVIEVLRQELYLHNLNEKTATKDHIYMFLSEKKLSDYYADINLIYFLITNVSPPDITEYRNELLEMHDQLEEAYQEVKEDERLNSLNVNWKLYKELQLLDYPCKKDDFFCLKTPTKQGEHEQKWYDMIEYLQKTYPNTMTSYGKKRWRHIRTL
jgi:hypothetical protein